MNEARRKELAKIASRFDELKALAESIKEDLEGIRDDEQEYFDNMPESLQSGEKGSNAEQEISDMEDAIDALGGICEAEYSGAST